jgi:hypothetical protein
MSSKLNIGYQREQQQGNCTAVLKALEGNFVSCAGQAFGHGLQTFF